MSIIKVNTISPSTGATTNIDNATVAAGTIAAGVTLAARGAVNGIAALGADGLVPTTQLQAALVPSEVANDAALAAIVVAAGDIGKKLVRVTGAGANPAGTNYIAKTAGSGADKWQVYNQDPQATTSVRGTVELATNAEARTLTDTVRALTPAAMWDALSSTFNMRAPRAGIYFDGTPSARAYSALGAAGALATDPHSVVLGFTVPSSNPAADVYLTSLGVLGSLGSAPYDDLFFAFSSSGALSINHRYAGTDHVFSIAGFIAMFGGQRVLITYVSNASGRYLYVNGVLYAQTTAAVGNLTNTYLVLNSTIASSTYTGSFFTASVYNLALSQTDAEEIYFLGGGVPYRFQFGSQIAINTGAWSTSGPVVVNTNTATAIDFSRSGGSTAFMRSTQKTPAAYGKVFRAKGTVTTATGAINATFSRQMGGVDMAIISSSGPLANNPVGSFYWSFTGAGAFEVVALRTGGAPDAIALEVNLQTDGGAFAATGLRFDQVGAVLHLPLDEGIGYQLHNAAYAFNGVPDAVITTTGVTHLMPKREGYVRGTLTWSGSHEAKSLLGQAALTAGSIVTLITSKANAGASGSGSAVGTTGTAARWSTASLFSSGLKKVHSLANQTPTPSSGGVISANDLDILVDPDTVNFTGSIDMTVHYTTTDQLAP